LPKLAYTRRIIDETLRLYSPAYQTMRRSIDEDVIDGYRVPAKADVYLNSYLTHRHASFWEEPERRSPSTERPSDGTRQECARGCAAITTGPNGRTATSTHDRATAFACS